MDIVVTVYLGPAVTLKTTEIPVDDRFIAVMDSILNIRSATDKRIYVACTGEQTQFEDLKHELGRQIATDNIDFIFLSQLSEDLSRGKGHLEVRLLQKLVLKANGISDTFLKISSKYTITNLDQVLGFVQHKNHPVAWRHVGGGSVETRCVVLTKNVLYCAEYSNLNDNLGYYFEHATSDIIKRHGEAYLFYARPIINGLSGTFGSYDKTTVLKTMLIKFFTKLKIRV